MFIWSEFYMLQCNKKEIKLAVYSASLWAYWPPAEWWFRHCKVDLFGTVAFEELYGKSYSRRLLASITDGCSQCRKQRDEDGGWPWLPPRSKNFMSCCTAERSFSALWASSLLLSLFLPFTSLAAQLRYFKWWCFAVFLLSGIFWGKNWNLAPVKLLNFGSAPEQYPGFTCHCAERERERCTSMCHCQLLGKGSVHSAVFLHPHPPY